jgi:hypothetical protein
MKVTFIWEGTMTTTYTSLEAGRTLAGATVQREESLPDGEIGMAAGGVRRLDGDHRWQAIVCQSGSLWITEADDGQDYVLRAGEMFVIRQPGSVVIEALRDASMRVTAPPQVMAYPGN